MYAFSIEQEAIADLRCFVQKQSPIKMSVTHSLALKQMGTFHGVGTLFPIGRTVKGPQLFPIVRTVNTQRRRRTERLNNVQPFNFKTE